jgi:hypothetical protein
MPRHSAGCCNATFLKFNLAASEHIAQRSVPLTVIPNQGGDPKRESAPMSRVTSSLVFAAIVVAFGAQSALAGDHATRGHPAWHGGFHHLYMSYRSPWYAPSPTLPYAPEYGFLGQVPANAIRGPGYTFVPGVGILGESCDLPTSACTNEYRDVQ